ncbi:RNA-directed DNA polymerase from mobile element jockey [Merluccius polli]|uniref:RNA-directed DNA polymerase from mobile element jockey n=1 Tax=Merluccius polli TaxID=89951 RepID=A0AA47N9H2_MERPO|nr:RNA-directed DNA polymerase from mobile element jockey [Merluccius polli]
MAVKQDHGGSARIHENLRDEKTQELRGRSVSVNIEQLSYLPSSPVGMELRQKIRKGKDNYRRKLEKRLEQNNARDVWRGLQNIAGHGKEWGEIKPAALVQPEPEPGESPSPVEDLLCGPGPKEPNHFRPVALTSHLMKTMERIILRHLRTLVGTQLDSLQFAYQPGIGVDDAVIYMLQITATPGGQREHCEAFTAQSEDGSGRWNVGVDRHLAAWTTDYLTNRPQFVSLHNCVSDVVLCSTGAPQGTVLSPFLFTLYTSDFTHNTTHCHIQKFSDDTAVVGCVSEGNELEYRTVIRDFVSWSELNQLQLNTSKTKEMIVNFRRKASGHRCYTEVVESYKFLGVHLNNKLDWTDNTHALYKKGQSRLHLLRRLRSFGVCKALLRTFYDSVMASAIFYAVVCWRAGSTDRDRSRLNKLIRRASSVLDGPLDSIEELGERRMLTKLTSIMDNTSHPLHDTVGSLSSSFSSRLLHPWCKKERFRRSFIPAAVSRAVAIPHCDAVGKDALDGAAVKVHQNLGRQMDLPQSPQEEETLVSFLDLWGCSLRKKAADTGTL